MTSCIVQATNSKSSSGFDPRSVASCGLWLDGADPNGTGSVTNAASITTWVDKSGNGRNGVNQTTAGVSTTNVLNGRPVMRLSGSSYLVNYASFPNTAYTIFGVQYLTTNASAYASIIMGGGASVGKFFMGVGASATDILTVVGTSAGWNDLVEGSPGYSNFLAWRIVSMVISGSALNPYVDGNAQSQKTGTTGGSIASLRVGSSYNGDQNWTGDCAEVLIYESALTTDQRQQIEGYLAQKWGMTANLPATHPFKSISLFTRFFQPTDIQNCTLWLDGTDNSTITLSGTAVTAVQDKAQNISFTTQGTSSLLTLSNAINNMQTLYFNNSAGNNVYLRGTFSNLLTGSVFIVWRAAAQSSVDYRALYSWQSQGALRFPVFGYINSLTVVAPYTTFVGPGTPTTTVSAGTNYLTFYSWSGTTTNVGFNGATPTAGTTGTYSSSSSVFTIMAELGSAVTTAHGFIGELIFYNTVLSASQRQQVEGYLAWKWGLQGNLPSGQPFKLFRTPTVLLNPLQVPNCYLWIDALDSSTVTLSGGNVTGVADKSGNGRNLSNGTGYTYNQTKFNSVYPSFYNIGASPRSIGRNTSFTGLAQPMTIFVVGQTSFVGAEPFPFLMDGPDGSGRIGPYWASSTQLSFFAGTGLNYNGTFSNPYIFCFVANTTSSQIIENGSVVATGNAGTNTLNGIILGSRFADNTFTGHVCEFILYNRLLSTIEIRQMEGYLAWKWGLQRNLLTNHPYYKVRP